jgi:hypothetical protein
MEGGDSMNCMKCGRETENEQVFCDGCLEIMAKYPVKPGIVIHLPKHEDTPIKKPAPVYPTHTPEEQVLRQKSVIRWLSLALVALVVAFGLAAAAVLYLLDQRDLQFERQRTQEMGRNYHVVAASEE